MEPGQGPFGFSDAARRCSDIVRQAIVDGFAGTWMAIRLSDGGSDGVRYARRRYAVAHQLHETQCMYLKVPWDDMPVMAAERLLQINRDLYDHGARFTDPDTDREPIFNDRRPGF